MDDEAALDLRYYLDVLRRRVVLVVLVAVGVTAIAVGYSVRQTPVYRTTAQVLLQTTPAADPLGNSAGNGSPAQRTLSNEIRSIESAEVQSYVRSRYTGRLDPKIVSASAEATDADVITVAADGVNPKEITGLVNAYVDSYLQFRIDRQVNDLLTYGNSVQAKITDLQQRVSALQVPLLAIDGQIATVQGSGGAAAARDQQVAALQSQRIQKATEIDPLIGQLRGQLTFYQGQLDKLELSTNLKQAGALRVLRPALVPTSPVAPKPVRNAVLGVVLGLLLGVGLAFLRDFLDDRIRDKATLETVSGLPTLGVIPHIAMRKNDSFAETVAVSAPRSVAAEAYRTLRTSVKFLGLEGGARVIQITSPTQAEGKTITAVNLAMVLAQADDRVIVVGCDLRRPRLDSLAHTEGQYGLTSVLLGEAELDQAITTHPDEPRLAVMRTGPPPPFPSELLSTSRMAALVRALAEAYDVVILDCPPVLPVTDAVIVSRYADTTLLLASEGKTSRRGIHRSIELLRQAGAPLCGTVLNEAGSRGSGYGYGYGYGGYGAEYKPDGSGRGPWWRWKKVDRTATTRPDAVASEPAADDRDPTLVG